MPIRKSAASYKKIFKTSWQTAWNHKELWLIGAIASIPLSGGSIFHAIISQLSIINGGTISNIANQNWTTIYLQNLSTLQTSNLIITLSAITILAIVIAGAGIAAQQLLITGVARAKKHPTKTSFQKILSNLKHIHVIRMLTINILTYLLTTITTLGAALITIYFISTTSAATSLIYTAIFATSIPILITINLIGALSLITVVLKEKPLTTAIKHATNLFKSHWVACTETGLFLLVANIILFLALALIIALLALPSAAAFFAALHANIWPASVAVGILSTFAGALVYLAGIGLITSYNYAVWVNLYKRINQYGITAGTQAVLKWLTRK